MDAVEIKKKKVQLSQVEAARGEQELRIMEREQEIQRLKASIVIQLAKEDELKKELRDIGEL